MGYFGEQSGGQRSSILYLKLRMGVQEEHLKNLTPFFGVQDLRVRFLKHS